MKTVTIELSVFEIGDVIDVSGVDTGSGKEQPKGINTAKRAMIIKATATAKGFVYKALSDNGAIINNIKSDRLHNVKLLGHIDLTMVICDETERAVTDE